jgi:hypothetical protein
MENQYIERARDVLKKAEFLKHNGGWQHVLTKNETELYKMDLPEVCAIPCYWVKTMISKPKDELVNKIWAVNEDQVKVNDPKVIMWQEVEKSENWKVCSQYSSTGWPCWPRHIVFAQVRFDDGDSTKLVAYSIDHPKIPYQDKTHVRSMVHMSVYDYKDNGDGTTQVTRIAQVDPCGAIPTFIVTMYSKNLVDMFNRWKGE